MCVSNYNSLGGHVIPENYWSLKFCSKQSKFAQTEIKYKQAFRANVDVSHIILAVFNCLPLCLYFSKPYCGAY